jgi:ribonuclease PH
MAIERSESRTHQQKRETRIETKFYDYTEGSCLVTFGRTKVLCVATVEENVPPHMRGKGQGWVTAEYSMLPRSSPERIRRERNNVGGRTQEIQRLIGRALRSVIKAEYIGERTVMLDCDVLQADGGTRTASVTGAFVALVQAIHHLAKINKISTTNPFPISDFVSAISVGMVKDQAVLDLDYKEDSSAETDMNLVMTKAGKIIEIQGTAERDPFSQEQLTSMLNLGQKGCLELCQLQESVLGPLQWRK